MIDDWLLREGDRDIPPAEHARGAQWLLAGHNVFGRTWYTGAIDGIFGHQSALAAQKCKHDIGYEQDRATPSFGPLLRDFLTGERIQSLNMKQRAAQRQFVWPTLPHGTLIGFPGHGTHSFTSPPNNWESDNAWDIAVPIGSKIVAAAAGTIGPQFGPLTDHDPRFAGIRLHLITDDNEFYYAHLSATSLGLGPGDHVKQGALLGKSGSANGVAHLHIGVKHLFPFVQEAA